MLENLELLNVPTVIILVIIAISAIATVAKDITNIWGFIAPKIFGIKTQMSKKKELNDVILSNQEQIKALKENQDVDRELSKQNDIDIRKDVSELKEAIVSLDDSMTKMRLQQMRTFILDFASNCNSCIYSKEQYDYAIRTYEDYIELLQSKNLKNGQIELAIEIINENYKSNMLSHGFLEDLLAEESKYGKQ